METAPLSSLYLHIPFCVAKCPYCDFFSRVGQIDELADYVRLLALDIRQLKTHYPDTSPLKTIYFGGGTPSLLSAGQLAFLIENLDQTFGFQKEAEISLEANPGTLNEQQLRAYRHAGLNRLSLGVQSFNDHYLKRLGRIHTAEQARAAIALIRRAGFDNLNVDLMFALPGQALADLKMELTAIRHFNPEHISIYGLSYETGTEFTRRQERGELTACPENLYADQYLMIHTELEKAGFEHYEISNFALPDKRCRHNQQYWQRSPCLAVGTGAHGFTIKAWGRRWHIPEDLKRYKNLLETGQNPAVTLETFDRDGALREYLYLNLRTSDGVDLIQFQQLFQSTFDQVFPHAREQLRPHLVKNPTNCHFTPQSWLLYDHLVSYFL